MIHPSSIIHPDAIIDPSVEIGPWCTVGPYVKIGKGTKLVSHVVLEGWTEIGEENLIFPFAVLGAVPQDLKYKGEKTRLVVGNKNTIRECVTMNLGTIQGGGETRVGNHCLIMASVHLGHDVSVGDHCVVANGVAVAGHVDIGDHAILGGMTGLSQYVRIGAHAYIGGHSGIERDVPPFTIALGTRPCILKGANIVGLKRRGFPTERIQKINEAIKLWMRPDFQKEQCLLEIESQYGELTEIQDFTSFIRQSESGVVR